MAGEERRWFSRHWTTLLAVLVIAAYAGFIEWAFGWATILTGWRHVGPGTVALALGLLVGTYFIRAHRMRDYFPQQTRGHFARLFRVTQIHNLVNIMLPFRAGEGSFPLLMRSEFGIPLAQGASALVVLRLLDLHALLAAGGTGLVARAGFSIVSVACWLAFLFLPLLLFPVRVPLLDRVRRHVPDRLGRIVDDIEKGFPAGTGLFLRAWGLTVLNWGVKVAAIAWILWIMGVTPLAASFGGALGGELSSVLPLHAPGGVGTYPAGIVAGATALGADSKGNALEALARASINVHLLIVVSAILGAAIGALWPAGALSRDPG